MGFRLNFRVIIALIIAIISIIGYFSKTSLNPVTGEKQHIDMTAEQEIALGLQSAPEMAQQYGGEYQDEKVQQYVKGVGNKVVQNSDASKSPYTFDFHVLADAQTVNAFALPGGQVFITVGLLKLLKDEGELAGVLGHEIGHVIGRHSAEHIAKQRLTQGLTGAAVLASYDPSNPSTMRTAAVAALIGSLINLKFTRDDENKADRLGVKNMLQSGYDPHEMIDVMKILQKEGGSGRQPEFFSTHPNPENRITSIEKDIQEFSNTP